MLIQDWHYQLIGTIPEAIAMVALGTALIKQKYSWKKILLAGLIIGTIGFFIQQTPIKYGVHIPIGIITYMLTLNLVLKLNILKSATASLISFTLVILAEILTVLVQTRLLNYSEEQLLNANDLSKFLFSLPPLLIIIALAVIMQIILHRKKEDKD
ncbi:MAG TPA: hypothetical protein PLZ49_07105 [Bacillota bacterium]|nr:hypothetical protein [Bacillota bacterium]HOL15947.1 hypothetical protein [Bacillota bacterium]